MTCHDKCIVKSLTYNFEDKELLLYIDNEHDLDMDSVIKMVNLIDPAAVQIQTFIGDTPGTSYVKKNGTWSVLFLSSK